MTKKQILQGNKLIAKFMGFQFIKNCVQKTDLYELGDQSGEDEINDLWILNPSELFLKIKRFDQWVEEDYYSGEKPFDEFYYKNSLKYHSSWDWIIPACKKWDELIFPADNAKLLVEYCRKCDLLDDMVTCYEIEAVFEQLVKNIKWYNGLEK